MMNPEDKIAEILKEAKLKIGYEISFPDDKVKLEEVRLALIVLKKNGMRIDFLLKDVACE